MNEFNTIIGLTHVNGVAVKVLSPNCILLRCSSVLCRAPQIANYLIADQLDDSEQAVSNMQGAYICDPTPEKQNWIRKAEDDYNTCFRMAVKVLHAAAKQLDAAHVLDARLDGSALCPAA